MKTKDLRNEKHDKLLEYNQQGQQRYRTEKIAQSVNIRLKESLQNLGGGKNNHTRQREIERQWSRHMSSMGCSELSQVFASK